MAIIWNNAKFAALLNGLNNENGEKPRGIRYSQGWTKDLPAVETESAVYDARLVGSYRSNMGLLLTNRGTGISLLILTDENHDVTAATAKQLSILEKGLFGTRFNCYNTSKPFAESMCGFTVEKTARGAEFVGIENKTVRALRRKGYSDFFEVFADILNKLNDSLKSWNQVNAG